MLRLASISFVVLAALMVLEAGPRAQVAESAAETYVAVSVDRNGALAITRADGSKVAVYRRRDQTTFGRPRLSADRTAVGAQAMYPNCCTSYDIPLALVVYENGREHRFRSGRLSIFVWRFDDRGRRVAFKSETVHFSCGAFYELRDLRTEQLIDSILIPEDHPMCPRPSTTAKDVPIPSWVKRLQHVR